MIKLIALCATLAAASVATAANPTFSQHGMVLFGGREALYASHLPMFHAPHDYQVVLRLRLADKAQDSALRERLHGKAALWTLAPEKFTIDRLAQGAAQPLAGFKADLVQGHFERGGTTLFAGADVVVEQVLLFRRLSFQPMQASTARYVQLGAGAQRFLVKLVDSRPDFDHIVAISAARNTPLEDVAVSRRALAEPAAHTLRHALPGAAVIGTVYFSTQDLK